MEVFQSKEKSNLITMFRIVSVHLRAALKCLHRAFSLWWPSNGVTSETKQHWADHKWTSDIRPFMPGPVSGCAKGQITIRISQERQKNVQRKVDLVSNLFSYKVFLALVICLHLKHLTSVRLVKSCSIVYINQCHVYRCYRLYSLINQ